MYGPRRRRQSGPGPGSPRTYTTVVVLVAVAMTLSVLAPAATGLGAATPAADAATVQDDSVQESDADAVLENGSTYYLGQVLYRDGLDPDTTYDVVDGDGDLVALVFSDGDGEALVDTGTDDFSGGLYRLRRPSGGRVATFRVLPQSLSVRATPERVDDRGTDTESTLEVRSNRRSYRLRVTATVDGDQVDPDTVREILGRGTVVEDDDAYVELSGANRFDVAADFDGQDPGRYRITFSVPDTSAATTVRVDVESDRSGRVRLGGGLRGYRGDVVTLDLTFRGTDRATLSLGTEDVNYVVSGTVIDRDGDGRVTVRWNTDRAGRGAASDELSAAGRDGVVDARRPVGGFSNPDRRISAESYPVNVSVGARETDAASVVVLDPNAVARSVTVLRAPGATLPSSVPDEATQSNRLTAGDYAVVRVQAAGLSGYVDGVSDLAAGRQGVSVAVRETESSAANTAPRRIDLADFRFVAAPERAEFYLFARTDRADLRGGEAYRVNFTIDADENPYVDTDVERSATFEVVDRTATFDTGPGGRVRVQSAVDEITGRTTLAAGTELTVTVRETEGEAFRRTASTTVGPDGRFVAEVDFSGLSPGREFSVEVRNRGERLARGSGVVVAPATVSLSDRTVEDPVVVTVDRARLPEGGFVVLTGADDGRLLGWSQALPAGTDGTVEVVLERPLPEGTTRVRATVHRNTGTAGYVPNGSEDPPYRVDGAVVSAVGRVTVDSGTTTAAPTTETTTPGTTTAAPTTETTTPGTTGTTSDGDGDGTGGLPTPGFGPVVALLGVGIAVVVALVIAFLVGRE